MTADKPERLARAAMTICVNCEQCRELMEDAPCQYFPRLFNLADRAKSGGKPVMDRDLAELMDLCNACGQCPCRPVQNDIRRAKDAFVERDGLPLATRFVENVQLVGRLCGTFPSLVDLVMKSPMLGRLARRLVGIHPDRKIPSFPRDRLARWVARRGLNRVRQTEGRRVAYFIGCTARYMFPDVAKATIEVLQRNGITVYVPEQKCCGMPTFLEGDKPFTLDLVAANLPVLQRCVDAGYDIVTACPTCSFMFKSVLARDAQFSTAYRDRIRALAAELDGDTAAVADALTSEVSGPSGRTSSVASEFLAPWIINYSLSPHAEADHRGDAGYFAALDANRRIKVATHVFELGEYLNLLQNEGVLHLPPMEPAERLSYFPPCHLREQNMGQPWLRLLKQTRSDVSPVGLPMDCCGLGGIMGFKRDFHAASLAMGRGLIDRMTAAAPDRVVTECLACRLQFMQMQEKPVSHPVELLAAAYRAEHNGFPSDDVGRGRPDVETGRLAGDGAS